MNTSWKKLTRAQQDLYIRILWEDGHSESAIAAFLKTTKGTIVRRRQSHLQEVQRKTSSVKSLVDPERFRDLLDIHAMDEQRENGVVSAFPPKYKMAPSEATQCTYEKDSLRCGFEQVAGTNRCRLHPE